MAAPEAARIHERYALCAQLASGGMATVHIGRLLGPVGFSRTVAIKRLRPQYADSTEFRKMFVDEARMAARVRHPNVVQTLDVVARDHELFVVMDYVHGESLSRLLKASVDREPAAARVIATVIAGVLHGLQAAHDATSDKGKPLGLIHRDISPQNIIVGADGIARVLDFGVAKAAGRLQTTREGTLKGKLAYMAPEQLEGTPSQRTDIYATSVVLWEALTGRRLFSGDGPAVIAQRILTGTVDPPSKLRPSLPEQLDQLVMKGLARNQADRFVSAKEMALALERCLGVAPSSEVGEWVEAVGGTELKDRAKLVARIEESSSAPSDEFALSVSKFADTVRDARPPAMGEDDPVEPPPKKRSARAPRRDEPSSIASASAVAPVAATRAKGRAVVVLGVVAAASSIILLALWRAAPASNPAAAPAYGLVSSARGPVTEEDPTPTSAELGDDLGAGGLGSPHAAAGASRRAKHGGFGVIAAPDTWEALPAHSAECDAHFSMGADGGLQRVCLGPAPSATGTGSSAPPSSVAPSAKTDKTP